MKPLLKLTKTEMRFWQVITKKRTTEWTDNDNLMASQMCRDFATAEELAAADEDGGLLDDICKRLHQGARLLGLDRAASAVASVSQQRKIVDAILAGV